MSRPPNQTVFTTASASASTAVPRAVSSPAPARFSPGRVVSTPGALAALEAAGCLPLDLLIRHLSGDWGDINVEDAAANEVALQTEARLLSAYQVAPDSTLWLITEADRSVTTFLLPEEY